MNKEVFLEIASINSYNRTWIAFLESHYLLNCLTIITRWFIMLVITTAVIAKPQNQANWPALKHHDIWGDENLKFQNTIKNKITIDEADYASIDDRFESDPLAEENLNGKSNPFSMNFPSNITNPAELLKSSKRQNKVIHLFPVPVDGECLSNDGRRSGTCYNAYECRNKGGQAKGDCALGFGVCCIFIADCNATISNNITYLVSPGFPSFMPNNITNCQLKIKILHDDISQLRFDFNHFVLGQPNRRTGVCDGDMFKVSGGPAGAFLLCGQNSGQHMYYDVGGRMLSRQNLYGSLRPLQYKDLYPGLNVTPDTTMEINLNLSFAARYLPTRLWEIRIIQIPFSQRAPAGCLQYFTGTEGIFQTYNFADNGRHLANHNYRICMRQEMDMCSIIYQPCDEESFRIGPSSSSNQFGQFGGMSGGISNPEVGSTQMDVTNNNRPSMDQVLADDSGTMQMGMTTTTGTATTTTATPTTATTETASSVTDTTATTEGPSSTTTNAPDTTPTVSQTSSMSLTAVDAINDEAQQSSSMSPLMSSSTTDVSSSTPLSDDVEGSGGDDDENLRLGPTTASSNVSRRPRPTRGGFDLLGFLRSAFDMGFRSQRGQGISPNKRHKRQFYSNCRDRLTMPCIVEDFIESGLGPLPGCEPVHCGMQFCSNGMWPCRIESTVTPFYVSIHFGDGTGKGSAEDNIGACLKYQQLQCMR